MMLLLLRQGPVGAPLPVTQRVWSNTPPPRPLYDAIFGGSGNVYRRVDILESDGVTMWLPDAPVIEGAVGVDMTRSERRTVELALQNDAGILKSTPDGFWYDKLIDVWVGVETDADRWEVKLGRFMIDSITEAHFPHTVKVTGRDLTKKLMIDTFDEATAFTEGTTVVSALTGIIVDGGITDWIMWDGTEGGNTKTLGGTFVYESGQPRWEAIADICEAFAMEAFFDRFGTFVARPISDPSLVGLAYVFATGAQADISTAFTPDPSGLPTVANAPDPTYSWNFTGRVGGNLASYEKRSEDVRIFNRVVVKSTQGEGPAIVAVVENNEPLSPTRIEKLGKRTYPYETAVITTQGQANELATALLKVLALESYDVNLESLVVPFLDAGEVVVFEDPDPATYSPNRFLLTDFSIPLTGGTMAATGRRVTRVG